MVNPVESNLRSHITNLRLVSLSWFYSICCRVIRWVKLHVYFSKAVIFIFGLISSHSFVDNAVLSLLMDFFTELGQTLPVAAMVVNVQEGLCAIFTFFITNIADAYTGQYKAIVFSTASYALGLLLWFIAKYRFMGNSSSTVLILLYTMMLLATVGKASKDPCLKAFLRYQLVERKPNLNTDNDQANAVPSDPYVKTDYEKAEVRRKFWWRIASTVGGVSSVIIFSQHDDPTKIISAISFSVMALAFLIFVSGKSFYYIEKPTGGPLIIIYTVFKAAFMKRLLQHAREPEDYYKNDSGGLVLSPDIGIFRWLDKAALLDTSNSLSAEEQVQKGRLCPVRDVQRVKQILAMLPMWTVLPIHGLVQATGLTFFVAQSETLNPVLPTTFLILLQGFISVIVPYVHDFLVSRWIHKLPMHHVGPMWIQKILKHRVGLVRIAIGMASSVICCMVSKLVESRRLNVLGIYGQEPEDEPLPMSSVWLVPQFFLIGLAEGLVADGFADYYNSHVDESFELYESPFNESAISVGKFLNAVLVYAFSGHWFKDTLGESRLDKYYKFLGFLSSGNLCLYLLVMLIYAWKGFSMKDSPEPEVSTQIIPLSTSP